MRNPNQNLIPLNMYGYSKQMFDLVVFKGLLDRFVGLKYFNVFGPNEYHKRDAKFCAQGVRTDQRRGGRVRLFKSHRPDYGTANSSVILLCQRRHGDDAVFS